MSFDALVTNPGRLRILTALAVQERQEFVSLRRHTQLTDGNLASHAKRLQSAGLIDVDKQFRDGKPVTSFVLTGEGRSALESHVRRLMSALSHRRLAPAETSQLPRPKVAPSASVNEERVATHAAEPAEVVHEDEWVD